MTEFFVFLALIFTFLLFKFILYYIKQTKQDNLDYENQTLSDKIPVLIEKLNICFFQGNGSVNNINNKCFSIQNKNSRIIINFQYYGGVLTVVCLFSWVDKEVILKKNWYNFKNINDELQLYMFEDIKNGFSKNYKKYINNLVSEGFFSKEMLIDAGVYELNIDF